MAVRVAVERSEPVVLRSCGIAEPFALIVSTVADIRLREIKHVRVVRQHKTLVGNGFMVLQKECMATGRTRLYIDVTLRFLICNSISVNIPMRYKNNNIRATKNMWHCHYS